MFLIHGFFLFRNVLFYISNHLVRSHGYTSFPVHLYLMSLCMNMYFDVLVKLLTQLHTTSDRTTIRLNSILPVIFSFLELFWKLIPLNFPISSPLKCKIKEIRGTIKKMIS